MRSVVTGPPVVLALFCQDPNPTPLICPAPLQTCLPVASRGFRKVLLVFKKPDKPFKHFREFIWSPGKLCTPSQGLTLPHAPRGFFWSYVGSQDETFHCWIRTCTEANPWVPKSLIKGPGEVCVSVCMSILSIHKVQYEVQSHQQYQQQPHKVFLNYIISTKRTKMEAITHSIN